MFDNPAPSPQSAIWKRADYIELSCMLAATGAFSSVEFRQDLNRIGDHDTEDDAEFGEANYQAAVDDAFAEIIRRHSYLESTSAYPFDIDTVVDNHSVKFNRELTDRHYIYLFLLLTSALNMNKYGVIKKKGKNIKAPDLFEELSSNCILSFLSGSSLSDTGAFVFGTANKVKKSQRPDRRKLVFEKKVDKLCKLINEGGGFKNRHNIPVRPQDDGLDVVGWRTFCDDRQAKLLLLAQCKTGSSWDDSDVTRLEPGALEKNWFDDNFYSEPIRVFMCSKQIDPVEWPRLAHKRVLILDRTRIASVQPYDKKIVTKCAAYVDAVCAE